jgi:soluble lytic murein transglycosylase-like protein
MKKSFVLSLTAFLLLFPTIGKAENNCFTIASKVAEKYNIPVKYLNAIISVETKGLPWSVSHDLEKGKQFKTKEEAVKYSKTLINRGFTNVNIGCTQLNWKWHKKSAGNSVTKLLDPYTNVKLAAEYLVYLNKKEKSWMKSATAYHSYTPRYRNIYKRKLLKYM